jgi:hypothetical protein
MPITHKRAKALTLTLVLVPTLVISCTGITDNGDIFVVMNQMEARNVLSGPVKRAFKLKSVKQASKKAA